MSASSLQVVTRIAPLRAAVADWRRQGLRVALVPTMGNLHAGHLDLVAAARASADRVVASVFVNPLQFGPNEDFDRYPRTLEQDREGLARAGCDVLFAPPESEVYPRGREDLCGVRAPSLAGELEGAFRPGFFDGVATVVTILFNLVQPDLAAFGEKDYQQLQIVRRLCADLHLPVEILAVPTHRAADGLALSSRNQYLDADERARAPALHAALRAVAAALIAGRRDFAAICEEQAAALRAAGFATQYLEVRDPTLCAPRADAEAWVVLVAAHLGQTRLIDNLRVSIA